MDEVKRHIITLLTDYGTREHFVACMKGVVLGINPNVELVDATHDVESHDVLEAAFLLASYYKYFPHRTIHMAVVDPGVGTRRRPIIVSTENYTFVGPDNGLLSFIYESESVTRVIHITADHFFYKPVSNTFHGRDIFAPVAAWISKGIDVTQFGEEITDYVKLSTPKVRMIEPKTLQGVVLHVDKFGNAITNFRENDLPQSEGNQLELDKLIIANQEISDVKNAYEEGEPKQLFLILGSSGFYEIATSRGSAAKQLGVHRGEEVKLVYK